MICISFFIFGVLAKRPSLFKPPSFIDIHNSERPWEDYIDALKESEDYWKTVRSNLNGFRESINSLLLDTFEMLGEAILGDLPQGCSYYFSPGMVQELEDLCEGNAHDLLIFALIQMKDSCEDPDNKIGRSLVWAKSMKDKPDEDIQDVRSIAEIDGIVPPSQKFTFLQIQDTDDYTAPTEVLNWDDISVKISSEFMKICNSEQAVMKDLDELDEKSSNILKRFQ